MRYMDDMVIWGKSRGDLKSALATGSQFLADELELALKPTPFINRTTHGLDFLGAGCFRRI